MILPNYNADGTLSSSDTPGQFPLKITNAEGETEVHNYDPRFGVMTSLTGPNGLTTSWIYDAFGRQIKETRADATVTRTVRKWVSSSTYSAPNAVLIEETFADGQPATGTYSDPLGRVVMSRVWGRVKNVDGNDNKDIVSETRYNKRGEVILKSLPYFSGNIPKWTSFTYDILSRPKTEVQPRGNGGAATVTYAYHGLSTTTTDFRGNTTTSHMNARDELVKVTDALGNSTHYEYDPFGNQTKMIDTDGNTTLIDYNILGQKTEMDDPDMGLWRYAHDVLGQLRFQKDAKNQTTHMSYDKLGRLIERTDDECTSYWVYGSAENQDKSYGGYGNALGSISNAKSIGKLVYSQRGTTERVFTQYDNVGRPIKVTQELFSGAKHYVTQSSYDQYSRVNTVTYPASSDYPSGLVVTNHYDSKGYLDTVTGPSNTIYWEGLSQDAFGHLTDYRVNDGKLLTERAYDAYTGRVALIRTTNVNGNYRVQDDSFTFDENGNLTTRTWRQRLGQDQYHTETFTYDALNRLDLSQVAGQTSKDYQYHANGNLKFKPGVGTYVYGQNNAGPHAVTSTTYNGNTKTYDYDANGNQLSGDGRTLTWSHDNKPLSITKNGHYSDFVYGVDRQRIRQQTNDKTTYYVGGLFEEEVENSTTTQVHYIQAGGQTVATIKSYDNGNDNDTRYLLRDHLGSVEGITDEHGVLLEQHSYDAFGQRRALDGADTSSPLNTQHIARGFTGHEHLDHVGIIHMNGRVYDPHLGRFMSADPFIQAPTNSQSLNRYTYVINNPLSLTDPSGFISIGDVFKIAIAVAAVYFLGPLGQYALVTEAAAGSLFAAGLANSAIAGFVSGLALSGGNLKAGFIGGLSGAAFYGVGHSAGMDGFFSSLGGGEEFARVVAHGVVGGVSGELQGGDFLSGFMAAGFTKAAGGINGLFENVDGPSLGNTIKAAVLGGTASVIGGGKFANGAITGAMSRALNDDGAKSLEQKALDGDGFCTDDGTCVAYGTRDAWELDTMNPDQVIVWDPTREDLWYPHGGAGSKIPIAGVELEAQLQTGTVHFKYRRYKEYYQLIVNKRGVVDSVFLKEPTNRFDYRPNPNFTMTPARWRYRVTASIGIFNEDIMSGSSPEFSF